MEITQGTKERIDVVLIAYIVVEIGQWRRMILRNLYVVLFVLLQIVEFAPNADQITNAIAVAVHKRAWIDLIDDATLPPSKICEFRIGVSHLNILCKLGLSL